MTRSRLAALAACASVPAILLTGCSSSGRAAAAAATTRTTSASPGDVAADFQGPPARPCAVPRRGQALVFRIEPDTPEPPCWKVTRFHSVRIVNATADFQQRPRLVAGSLAGAGTFRLEPGAGIVLRLPSGKRFAPGDHCVYVDQYPRACLSIWVTTST